MIKCVIINSKFTFFYYLFFIKKDRERLFSVPACPPIQDFVQTFLPIMLKKEPETYVGDDKAVGRGKAMIDMG